jgi:peptidoglycan hydrolase-like protein with peptidoglycan-binding domain
MSASSEQSARRLPGIRVRRLWLLLGAATVAAAAVAVAVIASSGGSTPSAGGTAPATAAVARRDLVSRDDISGELDYADKSTLAGQVQGTLTWLPTGGKVVRRGGTLYRVDNDPVVLMYGSLPAWRALSAGVSDGPDVLELERNLERLGYDPGTVDDHFSSSTVAAVKAWQSDLGLSETGTVDLGRVVFASGAQRIGQVTATSGGKAGGPIMDMSSTRHVATANVDAAEQTLVHEGDLVLVQLPSGREVRGRISSVSRVAETSKTSNSGATIAIEVTFSSKTHLPDLDQAPVTVKIASERRKNVVSVPVTALLAQPGGGFSVEVVSGDRRSYVPVQTGLFASGYVEVSGSGITPGTRVVVPR